MSTLPPHTGTLRPATVALRHILGYSDYSLNHPLALDDANFGAKFDGSLLTDILFVAVDIDTGSLQSYRVLDNKMQYSIGISVLDTRKIQPNHTQSANEYHRHAIESFQFTIGQGEYSNRARGRFLFGETKDIVFSELKAEFDSIIQGREYVLVFHGATEDMRVLTQLNIGLDASYIFDTIPAAQFPLQLHFQPSSERLLHLLGIPFHDLHAAGNDAHFLLRALVMIAVYDSRAQHIVPSKAVLQVLVKLEEIARYPIPESKPKPPAKPPRIKHPKQPKKTDTARTRRRNRRRLEREARAEVANVSGNSVSKDTCSIS